MKKWFKILMAATIAFVAWGCGEPAEPVEPQVPITAANISGVWKLNQWQGAAVAEEMIVYIEFVSSGRKFTLYQNVNSSVVDVITGTYNLSTNSIGQSILRGLYDYSDSTEWANRYEVKSLTASTMILQVYDEEATTTEGIETLVYKRAELPEEWK